MWVGLAVVSVAPAADWKNLYVFGDSYSDSGAGYVDGNGPTAVVYMARELGIPFTHAQDPARTAGEGLNFAVSGAQTGSGAGHREKTALLGLGMRNQVDDFVARVRSGAVKFDPATTLFFIAGGLNDRRLPTETTVANLEGEIKSLYDAGARHFAVTILPVKIPAFAEVGQRLDPALAKIPESYHLEGATIRTSRWGAFFDEVMDHPEKYGLTNTTDKVAGREIRNEDTKEQGDPAKYYYYHAGHPSTAVHRAVGAMLAKEAREAGDGGVSAGK